MGQAVRNQRLVRSIVEIVGTMIPPPHHESLLNHSGLVKRHTKPLKKYLEGNLVTRQRPLIPKIRLSLHGFFLRQDH